MRPALSHTVIRNVEIFKQVLVQPTKCSSFLKNAVHESLEGLLVGLSQAIRWLDGFFYLRAVHVMLNLVRSPPTFFPSGF